jgi:hypothetical protein
MSEAVVVPAAAVERWRRQAKDLKKQKAIPHHAALDAVARDTGLFPDWHHLIEAAKATEPAERAFKDGLVLGADIKDVLEDTRGLVPKNVPGFVQDERLATFIAEDFKRLRGSRWKEGDESWVIDESIYFRWLGARPASRDAAMKIVLAMFARGPVYVRLKGQILWNVVFDDDGNR